jgi:hypothetical protein
MPNYSYVDKTGALKYIDAADSNTALSSAVDIDPHSGVMLNQPSVPKTEVSTLSTNQGSADS